jgi:DNA ligase 1
MHDFVRLYRNLDASNRTTDKVSALAEYFRAADAADAAWVLALLGGRPPRRSVTAARLRRAAARVAGIEDWLFDECYRVAGDLAETIALLLPPGTATDDRCLAEWIHDDLLPLARCDEAEQVRRLTEIWGRLDTEARFVWNKLLTGAFRVGVSKSLVMRGLSEACSIPVQVLERRVSGTWKPDRAAFARLVADVGTGEDSDRPYPFCLAHPWAGLNDTHTPPVEEFHIEWKWDGIRAQGLRRTTQASLWSRGDELLDEQFPEIVTALELLPAGTVLDGEVLPWRDGRPLPFARLQTRITRKRVTRALLAETPAVFMAFDLLEQDGTDLRSMPLFERRQHLERLFENVRSGPLRLADRVTATDWEQLDELRRDARAYGAEGLMLKRRDSVYESGRVQGAWWKWKTDPFSVDAVLVYAQAGHGRRADLFTDYTFAVWHAGVLVPFAKAYSGLTDAELKEIDAFVKKSASQKFGPVRAVKPELVFEIAFEGLRRSDRHKSGVAVRFPRIVRWRRDKTAEAADTLELLLSLAPEESASLQSGGRNPRTVVEPTARQLRFDWSDENPG